MPVKSAHEIHSLYSDGSKGLHLGRWPRAKPSLYFAVFVIPRERATSATSAYGGKNNGPRNTHSPVSKFDGSLRKRTSTSPSSPHARRLHPHRQRCPKTPSRK